jgi:uncharacterized protein (TIGR00251 family)
MDRRATSTYVRTADDGSLVDVWVVPGASRTEIAGLHDGAIRIRVTAPPEGGKANRAAADALRRSTGAGRVELVRGATTRRKVFRMTGVSPDEVRRALAL